MGKYARKKIEISDELIEYLENIFPNKLPAFDISDRELWANVGKQLVIEKLKKLKSESETDFTIA